MQPRAVIRIVKVERVRSRAIESRRSQWTDADTCSENQAGSRSRSEGSRGETHRVFAAAGQSDTDGVEYADLRLFYSGGRQARIAHRAYALRKFPRYRHVIR